MPAWHLRAISPSEATSKTSALERRVSARATHCAIFLTDDIKSVSIVDLEALARASLATPFPEGINRV